ncbi:hypothetical protein conserved [Leishmania donovani]|uniref:Uncharacterized protein n=3 Tax=Leishmania donovani species complex TaxID=38574 RepID=A4HSH9_LEIIN|nr:conserved hypothetical protein [Leishmania infantum JPCM5]TPP51844.1 hypothetical protein CGC20_24325 [Leishmania donovani]CAC9443482.1 hypothetical_protein_-_conserved [Leishmania infantum]CAJ1986029.1 hypothetical protein conserved [Leishmania donovani]CAM65367.1 conserved hypothetical protein [Leishmania infantum JPCM5]SUZ38978.1 hypothetical_protein_-_conserved [Leishmania infantum]|eukprot:XP_001463020.1 conserved hypothetical protein [Leishmania infantum JPCM5]
MRTGTSARAPFTHGVAGRAIKTRVKSNLGQPYAQRFYNNVWTYRVAQLTTSNVRSMKKARIAVGFDSGVGGGHSGGASSQDGNDGSGSGAELPVKSDLQPHALHKFTGEEDWSIVIAVPKSSEHVRNLQDCAKGSLMLGHTDPQLFHWFKELGALPPRSLLSGPMELLRGDLQVEAWERTFSRHPVIHRIAQDMWESDESKTAEEAVHIAKREQEEDEKRMRRMSSSDWRAKFRDRERNPTRAEDEEAPVYVIKPETFSLFRMKPDVRLWMNIAGQTQRVWDPVVPDPDPLCRCSHRFIRMLNLGRQKLVPSLNMNYSLKLTNAFIFEINDRGMWAMGTQENLAGKNGVVREEWMELRLDFGKNQVITTEQEMEWWVRGLTKLGAPELSQTNSSVEDAGLNPEDFEYRHI